MVLAVPDVPPAPGPTRRRPAAAARGRRVVRALPLRRSDRRRRRLPGGETGGRDDDPAPRRVRPPRRRAVDDPHGRVHGLGRDDASATSSSVSPQQTGWAAPRRSGTSPTCSGTSRRCRRSSGSPASATPSCGAVSRRPWSRRRSDGWRPTARRCRAEFLVGSYSNGRDMPRDAPSLIARARDYDASLGPARLGDLLFMNGTDHQLPQPWLGSVVADANAIQDEYRFTVTSLADYLAAQPSDGLFEWAGELRSGGPLERAHGRRVEQGRRASALCVGRAVDRAPRRAAPGPPDPGRSLPGSSPRHRLAQARSEQRPRLLVRVQRRRGGRAGSRPLRRGASDRRRPHTRRAAHLGDRQSTRPPRRRSSSTRRRATVAGSSR